MRWKLIRNTQSTIIFQHRDLVHHIITAHSGNAHTWWMTQHINLSYTVAAGGMQKFMLRDMILKDRDAVFAVVQTIGMLGNHYSQATLEKDIRKDHDCVLAIGEPEYRLKFPVEEQQPQQPVVTPIHTSKKNEDFGLLMAQVIRKMMNEK